MPAQRTEASTATSARRRSRPTLEQVAERAGVSRATVSRVVNEEPSVDPRLAARVAEAIRELDYVPNPAARALMTRRSNIVSLLVAEPDTRVFGDPFFASIVHGLSRELTKAGVDLVLSMAQTTDDVGRVERFLRSGLLDGALTISDHRGHDVAATARGVGIPVVMGGRPFDRVEDVSYVDNDNVGGAALVGRRLLAQGRRRVGTVAGPQDMVAGLDRLTGFREAMGPDFDPDLVEIGDFTSLGGATAAKRLLQRTEDLDGLFVASDLMAVGALGAIRESGRRVPEDVALVGFDDADVAEMSAPPLTTVRQRTVDQGRLMAQMLLLRMGREVPEMLPELARDPHATRVVLDVELVVRQSG